jgi:hypothetical protein
MSLRPTLYQASALNEMISWLEVGNADIVALGDADIEAAS